MTAVLVLDTSVVVKWFLDEPHADAARRIQAACRAGTVQPVVPDLLYAECGNTVWKRVARGDLPPRDAADLLEALLALPLAVVRTAEVLPLAYRLAVEYRRAVYDAVFLAAAQAVDGPLVTADAVLHRAVGAEWVRWVGEY